MVLDKCKARSGFGLPRSSGGNRPCKRTCAHPLQTRSRIVRFDLWSQALRWASGTSCAVGKTAFSANSVGAAGQGATIANATVGTTIRTLIAERLASEPPQIENDTDFLVDLGIDWFARIELVLAIEAHFGIEIPYDQLGEIEVVGDLIRLIESNPLSPPGLLQ